MSNYKKLRWYRFDVARRIRDLEGDLLVAELEKIIQEIKDKKYDKIGLFRQFIETIKGEIEEIKSTPKRKKREFDPFEIKRSGDGRIVLFGFSNVGKSTLMNAITNTNVKTGNYLHTTKSALAGTLEYENVKIQIVDLPGFIGVKEDWKINKQIVRVTRTCDGILLVIDLSDNVVTQYNFLMDQLKKARLVSNGNSLYKIYIIGTKGDLGGSEKNYKILSKITDYNILPTSISNLSSLEKLKKKMFEMLELIRIYTKAPRKEVDMNSPFICPIGIKMENVAKKIHKDFVKQYKYAKVWGSSVEFDGQHVGLDHELSDKDVIEIILNK